MSNLSISNDKEEVHMQRRSKQAGEKMPAGLRGKNINLAKEIRPGKAAKVFALLDWPSSHYCSHKMPGS